MEKYQVLSKAGSGNFSEVFKARNLLSNQLVAIKQMSHSSPDLDQLISRELKIASRLAHPNIIKVKEVIAGHPQTRVVFEFMEQNLLELYTSSKYGINEHQVRCILYQCALALEYLHRGKIIHRDIKPENILINRKLALVKLIDFGLAKEEYNACTDYVATRWYRSPENLIGMRKSTVAIDVFALGCVAVELFTLKPLFPGTNTIDQLSRIFALLGTPTSEDWPRGYAEIKRKNLGFGYLPRLGIGCVIPNASPDLIDLLDKMLQLNPEKRITAKDMLFHPFFKHIQRVIPEHVYREAKRLIDEVESRNRFKSEGMSHKTLLQSTSMQLSNAHQYRLKDPKKHFQGATVSMQYPSRTKFLSINVQDPQRNSSRSREHRDSYLKVPPKHYNYLSHENLSPTQSTASKITLYQTIKDNSKKSLYSTVRPQRTNNILARQSQNHKYYIPESGSNQAYSRVVRNHSLLHQPMTTTGIRVNRSIERSQERSQPKVYLGGSRNYFGNKTVSYRTGLHY